MAVEVNFSRVMYRVRRVVFAADIAAKFSETEKGRALDSFWQPAIDEAGSHGLSTHSDFQELGGLIGSFVVRG